MLFIRILCLLLVSFHNKENRIDGLEKSQFDYIQVQKLKLSERLKKAILAWNLWRHKSEDVRLYISHIRT
jgi:hypothetical protein